MVVYNFVWDASSCPAGISNYSLTLFRDGMNIGQQTVWGTNVEVTLDEEVNIYAEVVANGNNGLSSSPATMDFTTASRPNDAPSTPGNFRADFVCFQ